jgi:hypothetical protein
LSDFTALFQHFHRHELAGQSSSLGRNSQVSRIIKMPRFVSRT